MSQLPDREDAEKLLHKSRQRREIVMTEERKAELYAKWKQVTGHSHPSEPPFKKGDWLATIPQSISFIGCTLHQAVADPQRSDRTSCGWEYRCLTYRNTVGADHFTKATKADLYAERDRLHKEAAALQERATQLHLAAEGLS